MVGKKSVITAVAAMAAVANALPARPASHADSSENGVAHAGQAAIEKRENGMKTNRGEEVIAHAAEGNGRVDGGLLEAVGGPAQGRLDKRTFGKFRGHGNSIDDWSSSDDEDWEGTATPHLEPRYVQAVQHHTHTNTRTIVVTQYPTVTRTNFSTT